LSPVRSNSRSPISEELELPDSLPTELEYSSTIQTFMADQDGNVAGPQAVVNRGPTFRIPFAWDRNAPSFDTEDAEDLMKFVDHVNQILDLAGVTDDAEKKRRITDYLSIKKKEIWRNLTSYTVGTYDKFLDEVYKIYPEVKSTKIGSLEALVKLCKTYKGVAITDEGLLKRFGAEYLTLVKKLLKGKAITTNSEACRRYLDTLSPAFATALRMMVSSQNILKKQMAGLALPAAAAVAQAGDGTADDENRKEDPIEIGELIKLAEQMAEGQHEAASTSLVGETTRRPSDFNSVKLERTEEKIEELSGDIAYLKDAFAVSRTEAKTAQADIMKILHQALKGPPPHRDIAPHRDIVLAGSASNTYGQDRSFSNNAGSGRGDGNRDCFYCDGAGHYSRECVTKQEHITKGWLTVENGRHMLGDGNYIPKEEGKSQSQRVENYWRKKVVSQNWYAQEDKRADGDGPIDVMESMMDEIRTLKVKLAQVHHVGILPRPVETPVMPTFTASAVPIPANNQPAQPDLSQLLHQLLIRGLQNKGDTPTAETYAVTRTGPKNGSNSNF
jgi:hypothetical protein